MVGEIQGNINLVSVSIVEDEDLKAAREKVKVLNETYTVPLKGNELKTQFLLKKLNEQGSGDEGSGA